MEIYNQNLGYYFLKERTLDYYAYSKTENNEKLQRHFGVKIIEEKEDILSKLKNIQVLLLEVNYPGLLIGTGTSIELVNIGNSKLFRESNNYKTGLIFDYTTGIPYIPGSSLKGVLRSFFPDSMNGNSSGIQEAKVNMLNYFLKRDYTVDVWYKIMMSIFEGIDISQSIYDEDLLPMGERDKFIEGRVQIKDKNILGEDYITPHKNILRNPIPIRILKIVPETRIELLFELTDTIIKMPNEKYETITKEDKLHLFKQILLCTGLGAKTNTGYGHFKIEGIEKEINEKLKKEKEDEIIRQANIMKQSMGKEEYFKYEFENEWDDETKDRNYSSFKEMSDCATKKEIANLYLNYFMSKGKPSKKTLKKIDELNEILKC